MEFKKLCKTTATAVSINCLCIVMLPNSPELRQNMALWCNFEVGCNHSQITGERKNYLIDVVLSIDK